MQTHHGHHKPFRCKLCPFKSSYNSRLKTHILKAHAGKSVSSLLVLSLVLSRSFSCCQAHVLALVCSLLLNLTHSHAHSLSPLWVTRALCTLLHGHKLFLCGCALFLSHMWSCAPSHFCVSSLNQPCAWLHLLSCFPSPSHAVTLALPLCLGCDLPLSYVVMCGLCLPCVILLSCLLTLVIVLALPLHVWMRSHELLLACFLLLSNSLCLWLPLTDVCLSQTIACSPSHTVMFALPLWVTFSLYLMCGCVCSLPLCHTCSGDMLILPLCCFLLCSLAPGHLLYISLQAGLVFLLPVVSPSHVLSLSVMFAVASFLFPCWSKSCALFLGHALCLAGTCSLSVTSSSSLCLWHGHALFLSLEHSVSVYVDLPVALSLGLCRVHWLILCCIHCIVLSGSCSRAFPLWVTHTLVLSLGCALLHARTLPLSELHPCSPSLFPAPFPPPWGTCVACALSPWSVHTCVLSPCTACSSLTAFCTPWAAHSLSLSGSCILSLGYALLVIHALSGLYICSVGCMLSHTLSGSCTLCLVRSSLDLCRTCSLWGVCSLSLGTLLVVHSLCIVRSFGPAPFGHALLSPGVVCALLHDLSGLCACSVGHVSSLWDVHVHLLLAVHVHSHSGSRALSLPPRSHTYARACSWSRLQSFSCSGLCTLILTLSGWQVPAWSIYLDHMHAHSFCHAYFSQSHTLGHASSRSLGHAFCLSLSLS